MSATTTASAPAAATSTVQAAAAIAASIPPHQHDALGRAWRHDGWTPERQRAFLLAIAEGGTVGEAAAVVGLSRTAAYAFRRRAAGAAFATGWAGASLLSRDMLVDACYARAVHGYVETSRRSDGVVVERHRFDNRLAMTMLARLDRQFEESDAPAHRAAQAVAGEFEAFLGIIGGEDAPEAAAHFLAERDSWSRDEHRPAGVPDLNEMEAPVARLARAADLARAIAAAPAVEAEGGVEPGGCVRDGCAAETAPAESVPAESAQAKSTQAKSTQAKSTQGRALCQLVEMADMILEPIRPRGAPCVTVPVPTPEPWTPEEEFDPWEYKHGDVGYYTAAIAKAEGRSPEDDDADADDDADDGGLKERIDRAFEDLERAGRIPACYLEHEDAAED